MIQPPTFVPSRVLHLQPGQSLLIFTRAGTRLQVRRGVLTAHGAPQWLGERVVAAVQQVPAGALHEVATSGWLRLAAESGPVELHCGAPAPWAVARFGPLLVAALLRAWSRRPLALRWRHPGRPG